MSAPNGRGHDHSYSRSEMTVSTKQSGLAPIQPASPDNSTGATLPRMYATEYRIQYRRFGWKQTSEQTRIFATRDGAEQFVAKLKKHRSYRDGYLAPAEIKVSHRPVPAWRDGWPS